jgi:HAD superfamily hydrolase (TIGR01509 family)
MESRQKLVIFDCDGVLVDSEPISFAVLREMLADAGVELSESHAYRHFLGKSMTSMTGMIADEFAITLSAEQIEAMRQRLFERFQRELLPVNGVAKMLADFHRTCCVASSSQPDRIRLSLAKTGLLSYFEPHIFSASMVTNGKPAPDLFLHAAEVMGYRPEECVVIEDSPAGIRAAQSAGMAVLAFTGGSHAEPSNLRQIVQTLNPTKIFDDYAELPALLDGMER